MVRPEPCVLFAQTFVHNQLDEYVDEVVFTEPVVITSCEFLEQDSSSLSSSVALIGASSPPSFALEVFVQSEGETRFKRLCQPFLYSHSSSNVLEVEAVVTSHLVLRGCYRSLSMVIYGNTAEDLGQFNIEVDLDSTLNNLVSSSESKLDDLPPALHLKELTVEDSIVSVHSLHIVVPQAFISVEVKQLLQLSIRIFELPNLGDTTDSLVSILVSAAASFAACERLYETSNQSDATKEKSKIYELIQAQQDLLALVQKLHESGYLSADLLAEFTFLESDGNLVAPKQLMDMFSHFVQYINTIQHPHFSKNKKTNLLLSMALLLCSSKEGCYHFVNGGGMKEHIDAISSHLHKSNATALLALGFIEQATRYSIGCEGFLSWWPRDEDYIPSGKSEGYSQLVKVIMKHQRHDVASRATYVLQRLRLYEVAARFECAVLSLLGNLSAAGQVSNASLDFLSSAKSQIKSLLKLLMTRGSIEDPSSVACASRSLILGQTEGLLSYTATCRLITTSKDRCPSSDIDVHVLSLLKERGFLPLSVALLSSPLLRSEAGHIMDIFVDIASLIEAIILSLLSCRSGLTFLVHHPELTASLVFALRGVDSVSKEENVPLRYASVLLSKGFVCRPTEVGVIIEMYLRAVRAVDRLLSTTAQTEEFLWVLWELCGLSRTDCGRQALLALAHFPEAVTVLIDSLHSVKEVDTGTLNSGVSPINLAIFHSVAEILEVIVGDSAAYSMSSWIGHALELHTALNSSSSGSNRKDAPARLLEWIDAGAVYHKYGVSGLLRYAAVLASGGDAHLSSSSLLESDSADFENTLGDSSSGSDVLVLENLSKTLAEKSYDGVTLRDSSIAQLTTAFRILAFLAENSVVATALYDEGAVTVINAVLINCRLMFERSSNNYDYLVDDGMECNSTSDLLVERNREKSLVDLLVPSLVLLIKLLLKLQESKEQYRNTKLMNALLRLHREVSPKLAASAAELSSPYSDSSLNIASVAHLIVSALVCWPIYGWTPGLFHSITENVQATSVLALGPKETCSLLCLLNDLFPEEGLRLWKNGMPLLTAIKTLAVGTVLGPQGETVVDWYLAPRHLETLFSQLRTQLEKIAQVVLHYAFSTIVVIQDMLRVLIVRIAYQKPDYASTLLHPTFVWLEDRVSQFSSLSDVDGFKVQRLLEFLASLLDHPHTKPLLLNGGLVQVLANALERCTEAFVVDENQLQDDFVSIKFGPSHYKWCLPMFKLLSLLSASHTYPQDHRVFKKGNLVNMDADNCLLILPYLLKLFQILPPGRELLACVEAFKEIVSSDNGQRALAIFCSRICSAGEDYDYENENIFEGRLNPFDKAQWIMNPPLLCCWKKLVAAVESKDSTLSGATDAVCLLCMGALKFSFNGKNLNTDRTAALRHLFGLIGDGGENSFTVENMKNIEQMGVSLSAMTNDSASTTPCLVVVERLISILMMEDQAASVNMDEFLLTVPLPTNDLHDTVNVLQMADGNSERVDGLSSMGELADKFLWECPETLPDRLSQASLSLKRKMASPEGPNRRSRLDNLLSDNLVSNSFSRGGSLPVPSGPSRRDNFRQRKPNTSRPPSMHVDDYVARERNVDMNSGSNAIAVQRVGSSGRPPSIHVDEFMARQRERHNPVVGAAGESTVRSKAVSSVSKSGDEKSNKPQLLKADIDDDLQGINIVFDGEEAEADDKLPFAQLDDNLQQPGPAVVDQNSPHSIVEETKGEANESNLPSHLATPNMDENAQSEFSSRMSASRPDRSLNRQPSVTSERKYIDQFGNSKNVITVKASGRFDSVAAPGSQGLQDPRYMLGQPPLPPMPPPPTVVPIRSSSFANSSTDAQLSAFHVQSDPSYLRPLPSSSSGSTRPPLPHNPPPYISTSSFSVPLQKPSPSQSSGAPTDTRISNILVPGSRIASYPPQLMQPSVYSRPMSASISMFGSPPNQKLGENPNVQNQTFSQPHSGQSLIQLQPLQPPQLTRLPHPPQQIRPSIQQSDGGGSLHQSPQMQSMQMLQQPQASPVNIYYNSQQHLEQAQLPIHQHDESSSQQQDPGFSLQQFFSSPEAIQSLLSDRDKLCQLLEQHPKLMQMLQSLPLALPFPAMGSYACLFPFVFPSSSFAGRLRRADWQLGVDYRFGHRRELAPLLKVFGCFYEGLEPCSAAVLRPAGAGGFASHGNFGCIVGLCGSGGRWQTCSWLSVASTDVFGLYLSANIWQKYLLRLTQVGKMSLVKDQLWHLRELCIKAVSTRRQMETGIMLSWFQQSRSMATSRRVQDRSKLKRIQQLEIATEKWKISYKILFLMELLKNEPEQVIQVRSLDHHRRQINLPKPHKISDFLRKSPKLFELYKDRRGGLWCGFTEVAEELVKEEAKLLEAHADKAAEYVSRFLMMSIDKQLALDKIAHFRRDLGLPHDFRIHWVHKYPDLFKVVKDENGSEFLELVAWNPDWAITELEKKVLGEVDSSLHTPGMLSLAFPLKFPPDCKKIYRYNGKIEHFQNRSYLSPYADGRGLKAGSLEFDKRAIAIMHELLSFTLEKRIVTDHLTHFRHEFVMPQKLMRFFLKHFGIFYVSERGKRFCVFLNEAYEGCELIEKHPLVLWKEKVLSHVGYRGKKKKIGTFEEFSDPEDRDLFQSDSGDEHVMELEELVVDGFADTSLGEAEEMSVEDVFSEYKED
ncbi:unnamed protein product [Rhodiola kirilowii]